MLRRSGTFIGLFLLLSVAIIAQEEVIQIDLIFDASGSMWGQIEGKAKITIARESMAPIVDQFSKKSGIELGLRVYGHLNKKCDNSVLEIPIGKDNASHIINKIKGIKPLGKTPIAFSMLEAINDFDAATSGEKVIILITDGLESCDGDVCNAARQLKDAGIVTKLHIVGFGMKETEVDALKCIAEPFNGKVMSADSASELTKAVTEVFEETISNNLEITAVDEDGNSVYVTFEVFKGDASSGEIIAKGDNSYNETGLASIPAGSHSIKITNYDSGDSLWFRSVEFSPDKLVKTRAEFAERFINVQGKNDSGEFLYCDVYLYDTSGAELKHDDTSLGNTAKFTVLPGVYDIKVFDNASRVEQWIRGIDVNSTREVKQIVEFAERYINVQGKNAQGEFLYCDVYVYDTSGEELKHADTSLGNTAKFVLLPGIYDLKVVDYESKAEQWFRAVDVTATRNIMKIAEFK